MWLRLSIEHVITYYFLSLKIVNSVSHYLSFPLVVLQFRGRILLDALGEVDEGLLKVDRHRLASVLLQTRSGTRAATRRVINDVTLDYRYPPDFFYLLRSMQCSDKTQNKGNMSSCVILFRMFVQ